jgi:RNA polymerase sigma-70 factor (ECF subfamily)
MLKTTYLARFNEDYEKYSKLLFGVAVHILMSAQEAEDVVQEVFIKYAEEIDKVENAKFWLVRTTSNKSIDRYRRQKTFQNYAGKVFDEVTRPFATISTKTSIKKELRSVLEKFDEKERTLLTLKFGYEMQYDEISKILEIPEGTIKSSISRILKRLGDARGEEP